MEKHAVAALDEHMMVCLQEQEREAYCATDQEDEPAFIVCTDGAWK